MRKTEATASKGMNPVIMADFPDADVIRVGDVYYMLSTTLHFLPGAVILRSYDLVNWEIASYVFETFEGTEEARMTNERNNYGCGMWAGSLKYHNDKFYVSFAAKETCKTYFYCAEDITGPWTGSCIDFYFHHGALFFDDDDRVYLVFGHRDIWIREMLPDLTGMKPGGFLKKLLTDPEEDIWLPYEGVHFHKINGKYYLFADRWPKDGTARRNHMCFISDSLDGEFRGYVALDDDMGYFNNGVAQGSLVQANNGEWYSILMQDHGAAGRMPVLVPVKFEGEKVIFGKNGKVSRNVDVSDNRPHYEYEPLYTSDSLKYQPDESGHCKLKKQWQWNHEPNGELWEVSAERGLRIVTGKISTNIIQAVNTLTQRLFAPKCSVEVTVDASDLNEGDFAGLCALQGCYSMLAITSELRRYQLVLMGREDNEKNRNARTPDYLPGMILEKVTLSSPVVRLRMDVDFKYGSENVCFYYREPMEGGNWRKIGSSRRLYYGLDHFAGCRAGLGVYATRKPGGSAAFKDFDYNYEEK